MKENMSRRKTEYQDWKLKAVHTEMKTSTTKRMENKWAETGFSIWDRTVKKWLNETETKTSTHMYTEENKLTVS